MTVFERMELAHVAEIREITAQIHRKHQKVDHKHRDKLYNAVRMKISQFALNKAYEQQLLVRYSSQPGSSPLKPCTGAFERVWGIPCCHTISARILLSQSLHLDDFCTQWHLILLPGTGSRTAPNLEPLPATELVTKVGEAVAQMAPHQQAAAQIGLSNILNIATTGVVAPGCGVQEPHVYQGKGRPAGSSNKRKHQDSSTRRDPSGFEHAERESGMQKCGYCKEYTHHNIRSCPKHKEDEAGLIPPPSTAPV